MATKDIEMSKLPIVARDPYLEPYEGALKARAEYAKNKEAELLGEPTPTLPEGKENRGSGIILPPLNFNRRWQNF